MINLLFTFYCLHTVINLLFPLNSNLGLSLALQDISAVHRIPNTSRANTGQQIHSTSTNRHSPIIVQFVSKKTRNDVLSKRRLLKGKPILITEQLTKIRAEILRKASDLTKRGNLAAAWSQNGTVLIKTLTNHITQIAKIEELNRYG